jgi:hypothetical protein
MTTATIDSKTASALVVDGMVGPPIRVEISTNAKGKAQPSVRVAGDDSKEVMAKAIQMYDQLCALYLSDDE